MDPVSKKPDFVELEKRILQHWRDTDAFGKLQRQSKGRPQFRFLDGPITANNPMGVHHAWGRAIKDVFIRYKVMNGHTCRWQNGFDCQGLWVEVEVEKSLGFNGKPDIEAYGLDKFSAACKARVEEYAGVITEQSERLGQWMDWDDSYYTHRDSNIRGIWHFLATCHENGWLYQKGLPMPWCARCGTSLSEHEMANSYKEMVHTSIFGQVPLKSDPSRKLLIWTTTPWTLTSNVAAAVHPDLDYVEVTREDWDHSLILCKGAMKVLFHEDVKPPEGIKYETLREFKGAELVGLEYETFFPGMDPQLEVQHRVIPWEAVDAEEGSGIVHIAPGCGKEDYELGQELGLPAIVPIDDNGHFVVGFGAFTGKHADNVPALVAGELADDGKLFYTMPYTHNYPVCWRCKAPLLFRLVDEWFIRCDEIRPKMKEAAATVEWQPDFIGKRMQNWLDNMGDWCISRKRYWGLPLPFYLCECGHQTVVGSVDQLREVADDPAVVEALPELHRPWIDEVTITCPACKQGGVQRVVEVGDCWLDAGIVPYSTTGFWDDAGKFEESYPAEWICEMREQVRLWFYSMLFMGVAISGKAPYERVLAYERVVAEDGTMFSKTGFMIRFDDAAEKMGADAMRWVYCRQPVTSDVRFGYEAGKLASRRLQGLWNLYAFYVTYARIDEPSPTAELVDADLTITDRWLMARTHQMWSVCTAAYESYDTPAACRELEAFLDDVSNWYVRLNRRRFWKSGDEADKAAAYGVLYAAIKTATQVLAPVVPFLTEEVWQNLVRGSESDAPESVHHSAWPSVPDAWADEGLLRRTDVVRTSISLAQNLRQESQHRVRQPLNTVWVLGADEARAAVEEQRDALLGELNVKDVQIVESKGVFQAPSLTLDFKKAGPVLRKDVNTVKQLLAGLDGAAMEAAVEAHATGEVTLPGWDAALPADIFQPVDVDRPGIKTAEEGDLTVALDCNLTDDLVHEGWVRDVIRHLQVARKESGFDITQRIQVALDLDDDVAAAVRAHEDTVKQELLATDVSYTDTADAHSFDIDGRTQKATVTPV